MKALQMEPWLAGSPSLQASEKSALFAPEQAQPARLRRSGCGDASPAVKWEEGHFNK